MARPAGTTHQWETTTIKYSYDVDGIISNFTSFTPTHQELFELAINEWENVSNINFVQTSKFDASLGIGFSDLSAKNRLGEAEQFDFDFDSIIEPSNGELSTVKLDFNSLFFDPVSFLFVSVHELGHTIGLSHNNIDPSIMGTSPDEPTFRTSIQSNDIQIAQDLYGPIPGATSSDFISGGGTDNILSGSGGHDTISGGGGDDRIYGNKETDFLLGGTGNDTMYGGQNDGPSSGSPVAQREGVETLSGGDGADVIYGNHGSDLLVGGSGADNVYGGQNDDTLRGGDGDDALFGNLNNDLLSGGAGNDTLVGNAGNDIIYGGGGTDVAVFSGNFENYTVSISTDFVFVIDNRTGSPDGTDLIFEVETLRFADQDNATSSSPGDDTVSGGGGDDTTSGGENDTPSGTDFTIAVNGSIGSPATSTIENFSDGTDKIVLTGFGFTGSGSPGLSTSSGGSFGLNGTIAISGNSTNNLIEPAFPR
jgi:Ca2+-binding RTX toxin-like protein